MNGETIKSFLVGLGFGVDDSSLAKFNKAIASATIKVTALYTAVNVMSGAIFAATSGIADDFEKMGYEFRIIAPAINKALVLRNELLKAYSAAGINIQKVIVESIKFNMSLAKTKFALEAIYKSVGARFLPLLTKQMEIFRSNIYANMPKIQNALERFIKFIFKAFEAVTILGSRLWGILSRVYDFFVKLHDATDGWSTIIMGVIAAWKLLNLSFLATPLGMILAGFTALLALWDDFKTFKEGGQSLIDWGSETTKTVVGIAAAIAAVAVAIGTVIVALKAWALVQAGINALLLLNPIGLWITGITALIGLLTALAVKMGYLKGVGEFFSGVGGKVMDALGGGSSGTNGASVGSNVDNVIKNMQNNPIGAGPALTPNPSNALTNQNVNQQTSIVVQGSSDAASVGKAVANEQGRVNFDMTRNLKGATR